MTTSEFKKHIKLEATRLYEKHMLKESEYDIYDDPNIDLYSDEPIQTHAQKKVTDFGTLDSEWVKSLISLGGKFDENTGVSFYTRNAELSVYKINDNFIVKIEHLGWEPEMGGSQFEKKRAKNIETVIGFLKKNISDNKSTPAYDELAASAEPQKLKILGKMNLPNDNKQRFKKVNENMGEEGK